MKNTDRFLPFIAGLILFSSICFNYSCKKQAAQPEESADLNIQWVDSAQHIYLFGINTDSFNVNEFLIERGDSPASIFSSLGFSAGMSDSISKVSARILDPKKLRDGMQYYTFETRTETPEIKFIAFARSLTEFSVIDFTRDTLYAYEYSKFVKLKRRYFEGTVENNSSLWNIISESGTNPLLALSLSDVFAWQIDFFDIKKGDSFQVIYNQGCIDDTTELAITSIEGAIINHNGERFVAIPFMEEGVQVFYDGNGQALRKAFLKAPLDFFRITSKFSNARLHPILKIYRPHHGVDYSAPSGTPVKTIGDGTVIFKGWSNGGGNTIRIRHSGSYETSYMHLRGYAKGVRKGGHVSQGEVIGYVGRTGLATGPHLDFRVYKNGTAINPLKLQAPPSKPIAASELDSFRVVKQQLLQELDSLHRSWNPQKGHI